MDTVSPQQRSRNMAAIKSRDTKPEIYLRKILFSKGYRYRIAPKNVPGHPDMWFAKYNAALFVHGCFWHRHEGCRYCYMPKSNEEFWSRKFAANIERDGRVRKELQEAGKRQIIVWECTIRKMKKDETVQEQITEQIELFLRGDERFQEI